ncbi:MAG: hypothetical protein Q9227_006074 [Pyrenula ochraceoflavens]
MDKVPQIPYALCGDHQSQMSGLVGYGSSSDEDEDTPQKPTLDQSLQNIVAANSQPAANDADIAQNSVHRVETIQESVVGPRLGPSVPVDQDVVQDQHDRISQVPMSERDLIQSLTAPTVPVSAIPPSPPGSPDSTANARFARFLDLKAKGVHFNEDLAKKSSFSNPSLFSSLLERVGLQEEDQYATSLPADLWNVSKFPDFAYKESLAKSQLEIRKQQEENRKAESAAGKRILEFVPQSEFNNTASRESTPLKDSRKGGRSENPSKRSKIS